MLPHYADAGNDTNYGTTMSLAALRSYLDSKGVDSQKWWFSVQTAIIQVSSSNGCAAAVRPASGHKLMFVVSGAHCISGASCEQCGVKGTAATVYRAGATLRWCS